MLIVHQPEARMIYLDQILLKESDVYKTSSSPHFELVWKHKDTASIRANITLVS